MENVEEVKRKCKGKESRFGKRYGFELKLRCVKLQLEEGLPVSLLSKEVGVSKDVIYRWVKAYQERGEAGLRNQVRSSGSRRKLPGPVREKMGLIEIRSIPLSLTERTSRTNGRDDAGSIFMNLRPVWTFSFTSSSRSPSRTPKEDFRASMIG